MTIVVASASSEGIALASDSRTTQRLGEHHRVASDTAQKVFDVAGRYGIATYGTADIGSKTIRGLFDKWCGGPPARGDLGMAQLADDLGAAFRKSLDAVTPARRGGGFAAELQGGWPLGFLVVGYDEDDVGRILEVRVRPDRHEVKDTRVSTTQPTVLYRGQTSVLRRMIRGVDIDEIRKGNFSEDDAALVERMATSLHYELIAPVTTQDAVDFAFFLVESTVQMQRFSDGTKVSPRLVPGCGGPVQGLVVEPAGVRWVRRNELTPPARTRDALP